MIYASKDYKYYNWSLHFALLLEMFYFSTQKFMITFLEFDLRGEALLYERQRYDGWYNNMAHPEWGAVGNNNPTFLFF